MLLEDGQNVMHAEHARMQLAAEVDLLALFKLLEVVHIMHQHCVRPRAKVIVMNTICR
jgi:hypothetical protein